MRLGVGLLVALFASTAAAATLPPLVSLEELGYSGRVWQSRDGLPEDMAQALAQTPDGYLWIGVSGGLVRFDGVRFTVFGPSNEAAFRDDSVSALLAARDGSLWIGTEGGGLVHYRKGRFRGYGAQEGLTNGFVRVISEDGSGNIWVGTDKGLFRMEGEKLIRIDGRDGIPAMSLNAIVEDRQGRLLAAGTGLLVLGPGGNGKRGGHEFYPVRKDRANDNVRVMEMDHEGAIWLGTVSGLRRLPGGVHGDPFGGPALVEDIRVSEVHEVGGSVWIGTRGSGLLRWKDGRMVRITAGAGLPHNDVLSIQGDSEGNLWVGTQAGLTRISPSATRTLHVPAGDSESINTVYADPAGSILVVSVNGQLYQSQGGVLTRFPLPGELANVPLRNVFRTRDGGLWLGTIGRGVYRLGPAGTVTHLSVSDGLMNDFTRAFCEARDGSLWIGTNGGVSHVRGGRIQSFNEDNGLIYNSVRAIAEDRSGVVWVGTDGGVTRVSGGTFVSDGKLEELRGQKVWALFEDGDGTMWIGTHGAGLYRFTDGRLTHIPVGRGIPEKIHFIAEDARGVLWLTSSAGVVSVPRRNLDRPRLYNTSDGLPTNQMNGGVQSAGALSRTGELWAPSASGVVVVTPEWARSAGKPQVLPPLLLEQAIAGDEALKISAEEPIEVQPGTGKLELHYTAIRLRSPDRLRFRYWMEGAEKGWNQVGDRRIAYFTNLSPGKYQFHVAAWDTDNPAQLVQKAFTVVLLPAYYQTWWFLLLLAVAAVSLGRGYYLLHVRNVRRQFEAVLEERSRLAREMHDTVIQGCVGVSTLLEAAASTGDSAPDVSRMLIEKARDEIRATVEDARSAVWNLRHSEDGGRIGTAIAELVARVRDEAGVSVELETSGGSATLGAEAERGVVLSTREALSNAVRHSGATRIVLKLGFSGKWLSVDVIDNGNGFEWTGEAAGESRHYGLIGMKERMEKLGGTFYLESTPGQGTWVRLRVPVSG